MAKEAIGVKAHEGENEEKSAFIVTPIASDDSEVRRATNGLIRSVVRPTLADLGYKVTSSHEEDDLGSITNKVISHLLYDDLVIVNLTSLNANVMYELGIRHATGKPVILMAEKGTRLPFDTQDQRTIFYTNDMLGCIELKESLQRVVSSDEILLDSDGNPVFIAARENVVNKAFKDKLQSINIPEGEKGLAELVINKLDSLEKKVGSNHDNRVSARDHVSLIEELKEEVIDQGVFSDNGHIMTFALYGEDNIKEFSGFLMGVGVKFEFFSYEKKFGVFEIDSRMGKNLKSKVFKFFDDLRNPLPF